MYNYMYRTLVHPLIVSYMYVTDILLQFLILLLTVTLLPSTASHLGCYCPLTAPGIQCQ